MPLQVLQRPNWHGTPIQLGDLFRLSKNRREARAALLTHQLGWEVRLWCGGSSKRCVPRSGGFARPGETRKVAVFERK